MELTRLSDAYMKTLDGEEMIDYLLKSSQWLMTNDLTSWKQHFTPDAKITPKRMRGAPSVVLFIPLPLCQECNAETFEDVNAGHVVCTTCGLIGSFDVMRSDVCIGANGLKCDASAGRAVVHRYSRLVYLRAVLSAMRGDTDPVVSEEDVKKMYNTARDFAQSGVLTIASVRAAIHHEKMPKRYLRNCPRILALMGKQTGHPYAAPECLNGEDVIRLLRAFRAVECEWDRKRRLTGNVNGRVNFMSYTYVIKRICQSLGIDHSCVQTLKSKALLEKQREIYDTVVADVKFSRF